jgi:hypothetical protein
LSEFREFREICDPQIQFLQFDEYFHDLDGSFARVHCEQCVVCGVCSVYAVNLYGGLVNESFPIISNHFHIINGRSPPQMCISKKEAAAQRTNATNAAAGKSVAIARSKTHGCFPGNQTGQEEPVSAVQTSQNQEGYRPVP